MVTKPIKEEEEVEEEVEDEEVIEDSKPTPKKEVTPFEGISQAQHFIDEMKAEIAELRRSKATDQRKNDDVIGGLRAEIEEMKGYIDGVKKQFEKIRTRPKQTLVPPPPPRNPEDSTKPVSSDKDDDEIKPKKRGIFGSIL